MQPAEFEILFEKVASLITLDMFAKETDLEGNFPKKDPKTSAWDAVDIFCDNEYIDIGDGRYVSNKVFSKVRVPFFIILAEFESRLFRIHEWNGENINELNDKNLNDYIKELTNNPELMKLQKEYRNRSEFMNDMKAISSFRNIIMHVNNNLEKNVSIETVVKRKKQIFRVLAALQEILDKMASSALKNR